MKRTVKRLIAMFLTMCIGVAILTGCGNDQKATTETPTDDTTSTETTTATAAKGDESITIMAYVSCGF